MTSRRWPGRRCGENPRGAPATGAEVIYRFESLPAVYVGGNDGKLYVLDAASGKSLFVFEAGGPLSASPAIASGRLVIGSQDGKLFCLG